MLFLNVWGSEDPFSHEMHFIRSMNSGDYGDAEIKKYYERFVTQFNNKVYSCLSALLVDIDCVTNQVTTVGNFRQAHPLKEKKIINTNAMEVRAKRLANSSPKIKIMPMPVPVQEWVEVFADMDAVQPNPILGGNAQ